jgi:hypothetical protein
MSVLTALCGVVDAIHSEVDASATAFCLGKTFPCHKGCFACCAIKVTVYPAEAVRLAVLVSSSPIGDRIEKRLRDQANRDQLSVQDYAEQRRVCAFLDGTGSCSVYAARPTVCRIIFADPNTTPCTRKNILSKSGVRSPVPDDVIVKLSQPMPGFGVTQIGPLASSVLDALAQIRRST